MSDLRTVLKDLGGIFILTGFVSLVALVVPLYFGEYGSNCSFDGIAPLLITSSVFFGFGLPFIMFFERQSLQILKVLWLLLHLVGFQYLL